jgi:hypothetical protein
MSHAAVREAVDQVIALSDRCAQRVAFGLKPGYVLLEIEHAPDGRERHSLSDQPDNILNPGDLDSGVPPLAARGPGRADHLELVEPAQERLLDLKHGRHLAHGEKRRVLIVKREAGHGAHHDIGDLWAGP